MKNPPRYDKVYRDGVEWLDTLAKQEAMSESLTALLGKPVEVLLKARTEELACADVLVEGREPTDEESAIILKWFRSWDEEAFQTNLTTLPPGKGPVS